LHIATTAVLAVISIFLDSKLHLECKELQRGTTVLGSYGGKTFVAI